MSLDDIRLTQSIDLVYRAEYVRDTLVPELDDAIETAEAMAADDDADDPPDDPDDLRQIKTVLEGQASACDRVAGALNATDECVFTIQELLTSETALLKDDVAEQSLHMDFEREEVSGLPKQGYGKIRFLQLSIVDAPDEMPFQTDRDLGREVYEVGKLPDTVSDWLYECAAEFNDAGELEVDDVGNLSSYDVTSSETSSV